MGSLDQNPGMLEQMRTSGHNIHQPAFFLDTFQNQIYQWFNKSSIQSFKGIYRNIGYDLLFLNGLLLPLVRFGRTVGVIIYYILDVRFNPIRSWGGWRLSAELSLPLMIGVYLRLRLGIVGQKADYWKKLLVIDNQFGSV